MNWYNNYMDIRKIIKMEMLKKDIKSESRLAEMLEMSSQSYNQMIKKNDLKLSTLEKIAGAMGCELEIIFKDKE